MHATELLYGDDGSLRIRLDHEACAFELPTVHRIVDRSKNHFADSRNGPDTSGPLDAPRPRIPANSRG